MDLWLQASSFVERHNPTFVFLQKTEHRGATQHGNKTNAGLAVL